MEETKTVEEWSGCCSKTSKPFVKYLTQVLFGASICVFSMIQIARADVENKEIFYSMLTGTLGIFLPHPTIAKAST